GAICRCIDELLAVLDHVPLNDPLDQPFLLGIEDVFHISGKGTVVTGRVERGWAQPGDEMEVVGLGANGRRVRITGIESFARAHGQAVPGDNVGLLLRLVERDEVERGQVLAWPGSVASHTHFMARIRLHTAEEGGRHTPVFSGYRPQWYCRTTDVSGRITLLDGLDALLPGEQARVVVELLPDSDVALEVGQRLVLREGGRT